MNPFRIIAELRRRITELEQKCVQIDDLKPVPQWLKSQQEGIIDWPRLTKAEKDYEEIQQRQQDRLEATK